MVNYLKIIYSLFKFRREIKRAYKNNFKTVPRPLALHLETTYSCTCKCAFCSRWKIKGRAKEELSHSQIIDLIDQAYELGVKMIILSGGEPLLKKGILDAMLYARKKGMITNMTTNGTLINENNVEGILSAFDIINISLDSYDEKKHDEIRGVKGTYKKAINTIKLLNKHSKNVCINIQSTLTADNFKDIMRINKELSAEGISTLFQPMHVNPDNNFNISNKKFSDFNFDYLKEKWGYFMNEYKYQNAFDRLFFRDFHEKSLDFIEAPFSVIPCFNCFAGSLSFFINPYGEVFPCESLRISMGNIKNRKLTEIWYDEKNNELRRKIKARECSCWLLCSAPIFMNFTKVMNNSLVSYYEMLKYLILLTQR